MVQSTSAARVERQHGRALSAFAAGNLDAALAACDKTLELDPDHVDANFIAGVCALKQGRYPAARPRLERAATLAPNRADCQAELGRCLAMLGRNAEALAAAGRAAALSPADATTHDTIGAVYTLAGRHEKAAQRFESAVRLWPENAEFLNHLATALTFCGELERAEAIFERVLEIDPHHVLTHLALADNLQGPPPPGRIEQLETTLERVRGNTDAELFMRQALGRTLEAAGETGRAFAEWDRAKRAKKAAVGYSIGQDKALFQAIERLFPPDSVPESRPGAASSAPVFVIGLPRTGTTLVERILSSHSGVTSGGELSSLPQAVREASGVAQLNLIDPKGLPRSLAADPKRLGERYLELARTVTGDAERFVDKQPLNFFYVGLIRRVLPNAKIVCLRRKALDTCLASFRHLFAPNFRYYRYALTPEDSAEYFALFTRLMAHWDRLFPGAICHVGYERLVSDFDAEARRLVDFLELDFEEGVADFTRNQSPVATASAVQVRQALHRRSVGAWRRYETELQRARKRLVELGIDPE